MKSAMPIVVLGAGAIAIFAMAGKSKAATAPPATASKPKPKPKQKPGNPPPDLVGQIVAMVASQDPAKMRAFATKLDSMGWLSQADDLRRTADVIAIGKSVSGKAEAARVGADVASPSSSTSPPPPPRVPREPQPATPLPGLIPPMHPDPPRDTPLRAAARVMIVNLSDTAPGLEDRELVKAYQQVRGLKPSGIYGPGTAKTLVRLGHVPPKPRYWPKTSRAAAKTSWKKQMLTMAVKDPQRADEWTRAAIV